jgi:hypothetical protein
MVLDVVEDFLDGEGIKHLRLVRMQLADLSDR